MVEVSGSYFQHKLLDNDQEQLKRKKNLEKPLLNIGFRDFV